VRYRINASNISCAIGTMCYVLVCYWNNGRITWCAIGIVHDLLRVLSGCVLKGCGLSGIVFNFSCAIGLCAIAPCAIGTLPSCALSGNVLSGKI